MAVGRFGRFAKSFGGGFKRARQYDSKIKPLLDYRTAGIMDRSMMRAQIGELDTNEFIESLLQNANDEVEEYASQLFGTTGTGLTERAGSRIGRIAGGASKAIPAFALGIAPELAIYGALTMATNQSQPQPQSEEYYY